MSTEDEDRIYESASSKDAAVAEVKKKAAERWGVDKFVVTVSSSPSKNLSTGEVLLYTAVARYSPKTDKFPRD